MTLNDLADLFGPSMLLTAKAGALICLGVLLGLSWSAAWPEIRFRYRQWQLQRSVSKYKRAVEKDLRTWDSRYRRPDFHQSVKVEGNRTPASGRESQGARIHWR
jgi:hypothetical protein